MITSGSTTLKNNYDSIFSASSPMVPAQLPKRLLLNRLREAGRVSAVTARTAAAVASSDPDRPVATNRSRRTPCRRKRPTQRTRRNRPPVAADSAHPPEAETPSRRRRHRRRRQTAPRQHRTAPREQPDRLSTS